MPTATVEKQALPLLLAGMVSDLKGEGGNMQLPDKNIYFSFEELTEKWQCTKAELLKHIFNQSLTPSIHVFSMYKKLQIQTNSNGNLRPVPIEDSDQHEWTKGFYYLIFLAAANPYEMGTPFFSSSREPKKGDYCYRLNGAAVIKFDAVDQNLNITIEKEKNNIFFIKDEIERFELEHSKQIPKDEILNKQLSGKSKTTALQLIGGLVNIAYAMDIHAKRLTGVSEIIKDLNLRRINITEDTLSKWIKEAAQVIEKPDKNI